jgi:hypothetical protein
VPSPHAGFAAFAALTACAFASAGFLFTDPDEEPAHSTIVEVEPSDGSPAMWTPDPASRLSRSSSAVRVLVSRLECNGGVTGNVLAPGIRLAPTEVVITFAVEALPPIPPGVTRTCPSNELVPYEVDVRHPLGGRRLVDGVCRGAEKSILESSVCEGDDGVRWRS